MYGIRSKFLAQVAGFAIALLAAVAPQSLRAESLGDALVGAYRNSALLEQNRALLRAADEGVAFEVGKLRPVLSYALSHTRSDTVLGGVSHSNTASLSASMLLWDFGATELGIEAQKESVLATRQALIDVEQTVLSNAVNSFITVRTAAELVLVRQNNVRLITEQLRAANDRFEVGEITRTDVALAEARLAQARSNLVAAEGDLAVARELYKVAVGRYPGNLQAPPSPPNTASTLEEAKAIAVRTHPAIRQAQHGVRAAELAADAAETGIMPKLIASANLSRDIANGQNASSLSLSFSGPIYSGGQISSGYRRLVAQSESSRAQLRIAVQSVEQAVANAWFGIDVANARIEASDRQIRASTVAFRGVQEEATLGARTTLDVLNAEQDLLDARTSRINAEAESVRAVYTLLSAMGLLTVDHLRLGIPTYDPAAYYNSVKNAPVLSERGARLDRILGRIGSN